MNKCKIIKMKDHPYGYKYNCQITTNGWYCGNGKFFKTKKEAIKFKREVTKWNSLPLNTTRLET